MKRYGNFTIGGWITIIGASVLFGSILVPFTILLPVAFVGLGLIGCGLIINIYDELYNST